ncbi:tyrosine-type recombinase/integrase [Alkalibacterium sp. MB6]|uniref:tyrosine-type recombinase/integrase n=1 Tax=Alkalibacterium sp. MB6 TaxID=2081965 RepID=UPI001379EC37|nr:site-specific integrase [Alkalibacterium sp. MB6]
MKGSLRKRGNNWYYSLEMPSVDGKRRRVERYGGKTKGEARLTLNRAIDEYVNSGSLFKVSEISCSDFFEYWFKNYVETNLKENTQENYRSTIDNHLLPYLSDYKLKQVGPEILQDLLYKEVEKGFAKKTVAITKSVLVSSLRRAVYPYQLIKENPMTHVEMPKFDTPNLRSKEDLKILSKKEFKKLREYITPSNHMYMPMMIAYHTGMRRGEVCGLEWDAISFEDKTITVKKNMIPTKKNPDGTTYKITTPKTPSSYREIDIGDTLISLLKTHKKKQLENKLLYGMHYTNTNFVCTKENGEPVTPNVIKWNMDKANQDAGIDFDFHSFRHTHATQLLELGVNIKAIQLRLGHSRISTTMDTYMHLTKKEKRKAADIFDAAMRE